MEITVSEIYKLLESAPQAAEQLAKELLIKAKSQEEKDSINWAHAYALVELKCFDRARKLWADIFERTRDHKALHQIGYVARSSGQLESALKIYLEERNLISRESTVAIAANLYELAYCNHLLDNRNEALQYFREYEELDFANSDLIERGCFFRLKGDIFQIIDPALALAAYLKSLELFREAQDEIGCSEVQARLHQL